MSKKNCGRRTKFAAVCATAVCGALVSAAPCATLARGRQISSSPAAVSRQSAVIEATREVLKETGELRRLPPLRLVKSGVKTRDQIKYLVVSRLNEDATPEQLRGSEATLRKLGLVDAAFRLRPFLVNLLTEQIAGYYDPRAREFYLADWIDIDAQKLVMSHELTHALQDQHFDLRRFERWPKGESDAELAAQALIEGDATLLMYFYVTRDPKRALSVFKSMLATGVNTKQLDRAPRALRASLLFPYEQGKDWALALYERGGWELLSKAYQDLPQSTEQILHAEKYFAREKPERIELPDVARQLGPSWRRVDHDVNGEWGYYLILGEFVAEDESRRAAAGWSGDRYALYQHTPTARACLIHLSAWDSEEEAREFTEAYVKRTAARYQIHLPASPSASPNDFALHTNQGEVLIERRGPRVLIVEGIGARHKAQVMRVLRAAL